MNAQELIDTARTLAAAGKGPLAMDESNPTSNKLGSRADQPKAPDSKTGSKPDAKDDLKSLPLPDVERKLGSSADGLSQAEAQKRLTQYGPNEIEEKKTNTLLKFLTYFWGPIPWMIEAAVILSAVARHWPDFAIILLLLLANAVAATLSSNNCATRSMPRCSSPTRRAWRS